MDPVILLREMGDAVMAIAPRLADEGDRVYLGSTNDADKLRQLSHKYQTWAVDNPTEEELREIAILERELGYPLR